MDGGRFDLLTRALGEKLSRRRTAGSIAAIAAGLGNVFLLERDDALAKKGGKKKKNKHKGQFRCDPTGKWVNKCVGGQVLVLTEDDCRCECPEGTFFESRCNLCLASNDSRCCPNEKKCYGVCEPKNQCCLEFERECTGPGTVKTCVPYGTCCPGEVACPIAEGECCNAIAGEECAAFEGCCNTLLDKYICDGKYCCEENEDCCANQGCVPKNQACCITPCSVDPKGCCGVGEQCCPISGCRPEGEQCCGVGETYIDGEGCCNTSTHTNCGGIKCCEPGTTCTVGSSYGGPRAGCCDPGEFPCDGVCCVEGHCGCCVPGQSNPCLCC